MTDTLYVRLVSDLTGFSPGIRLAAKDVDG